MIRVMLAVAVTAPALAQAACTNDLPGRDVLNVYMTATSDGVIGAITANQCGIEVSDFCDSGRCLAFFQGLSGYIDVTGLQSGSIIPMIPEFSYVVTQAEGEIVTADGIAPLTLGATETFRIVPGADDVSLMLPPPFDQTVTLTSTGSSGWEGTLQVSQPDAEVGLYLDRLGAQTATLEFFQLDPAFGINALFVLDREVIVGAPPITPDDG